MSAVINNWPDNCSIFTNTQIRASRHRFSDGGQSSQTRKTKNFYAKFMKNLAS